MPLSDEIQDNKENYNERYGTDRAMYSLGSKYINNDTPESMNMCDNLCNKILLTFFQA